jgi:hypothetical protein
VKDALTDSEGLLPFPTESILCRKVEISRRAPDSSGIHFVRDQLKWTPVKRPIAHQLSESITFRQF